MAHAVDAVPPPRPAHARVQRRAARRYTTPLRLYLIASVVYFFVGGVMPPRLEQGRTSSSRCPSSPARQRAELDAGAGLRALPATSARARRAGRSARLAGAHAAHGERVGAAHRRRAGAAVRVSDVALLPPAQALLRRAPGVRAAPARHRVPALDGERRCCAGRRSAPSSALALVGARRSSRARAVFGSRASRTSFKFVAHRHRLRRSSSASASAPSPLFGLSSRRLSRTQQRLLELGGVGEALARILLERLQDRALDALGQLGAQLARRARRLGHVLRSRWRSASRRRTAAARRTGDRRARRARRRRCARPAAGPAPARAPCTRACR